MMSLKANLNELAEMPPAQLRSLWRDTFKAPAPEMTPDLLRRSMAYRLQERQHGGLTPSVKKQIAHLQRRLEKSDSADPAHDIVLKAGTRLVREWNNKTYHVLVCDEGFEFEKRQYRSLSQIAEEITGAHWSGPRFFGLKKRSKPKAKAMANA